AGLQHRHQPGIGRRSGHRPAPAPARGAALGWGHQLHARRRKDEGAAAAAPRDPRAARGGMGGVRMSRPLTTVDLPDGRTLAYAEWGDPAGRPIVTCHGTPGCRLNRHPNQDLVRSTGARVIAFDRPGYGRSTRNAGRRVVDVVPDVVALVDHLGLDEFAVVGGSGGGPHALAVAASMPDRVTRVGCIVGVASYDALGDEWFTGMDPMNVKEFGWALEGEQRLQQELSR